ncbi:MAG: SDR family oxidoreductase [Patescibacteria group bacterium]
MPKAQHQDVQPGKRSEMNPIPVSIDENYQGSNKLAGKFAVITGGDSGIGRAVALHFAKEGADIAIIYLDEDEDAQDTANLVQSMGKTCNLFKGDIGNPEGCQKVIEMITSQHPQIDILVNNAAEQHPQSSLQDITPEQLQRTYMSNIFGMFYLTGAALNYMSEGSSIINTTSVTAYKGNKDLIDYSSTKGAIVSFTRSLALNLAERKIRVNAVAPGPIWTPLIPSTFPPEKVEQFGSDTPMGRPGQPCEVAPCYVFLASNIDSSYISGQVLHPNGGSVING